MLIFQINYLAVIAAAVIYMGVAALWYSPLMFGRSWMRENKLDEETLEQRGMFPALAYAFIAALVLAFGIAMLIALTGRESWFGGALIGLFAGVLISAPAALPVYVFENRSLHLYALNEGMPVIAFAIMGAVIGGWQ